MECVIHITATTSTEIDCADPKTVAIIQQQLLQTLQPYFSKEHGVTLHRADIQNNWLMEQLARAKVDENKPIRPMG